ncbi:MAG: Fructose-1,6-bisphosphatase/inositol-1-monophosphatase [Planctomycetes bacterium]|nr:Fructose-1,6-bisphosphatase/inositol-1-monophosphatase [Planctomycetota bacterium]
MTDDLALALEAARAGGDELMRRYRVSGIRENATTKSTRRDLVTDADRAAEAAVLGVLRGACPDDVFLAEESANAVTGAAEASAAAARGGRVWIVDPLDGTVNFAHGIPCFAVSVGLLVGGTPSVGVVHAPALAETHAGAVGCASAPGRATLNGAPVRVSATDTLPDALVATGFAYDIENLADDNLDNLVRVARAARGLRRLGSAALDLAWVACGRLDAFWELHLSPWDVAGGAALVTAAGGRVTDMTGGPDFIFGRHVLATNGRVHDEVRGVLRRPSFAR